MQLEIPQDIIDINRECVWELTEYAEFDISISVDKQGKAVLRDMLGMWNSECDDLQPEVAWNMIRKWWSNEQERVNAARRKEHIENKIKVLQEELTAIDEIAEKKKWFWQR